VNKSRGAPRWGTGSVPSDKRREDEQSKVERNPNPLDFEVLVRAAIFNSSRDQRLGDRCIRMRIHETGKTWGSGQRVAWK